MNDETDKPIANAHALIERFGGIRPMATKMNVPVTTVQGWKERGLIPGNRREDILAAAAANGISVVDIIDADPDFESLVKNNAKRDISAARHEQAIEAGRITALQDELARKTKGAERRAVQKSALIAVGLVLLTAGLCGFLAWAELRDVRNQAQRLREAEETISMLKEEIAALKETATQPADNDLRAQVELLSGRIDSLPTPAPTIAPDLTPLENRIVKLEEEAALRHEKEALVNGVPPPAAPTPVALLPELKDLHEKLKAQEQPADNREKIMATLGDYLQVRKDGQLLTGSAVDTAFGNAENSLNRGDISGAIAALEVLPSPARAQAQSWIDLARAQIAETPKPASALPPAPALKEVR